MKVEQGQAALLTGGASGIGRALAVALAGRGVRLSIVDLQVDQGQETVRLVEEEHAKIGYKPPSNSPSAIFIRCNVADTDELAGAFARHHDMFGQLHICVNNAGVGSATPFYKDESWRKMIHINLTAVIDASNKSICAMKDRGGLILNIASSTSFMPANMFPVYSASKACGMEAGVAMFARSLSKLGMGIRVNALCPELVDTPALIAMQPEVNNFYVKTMGFVEMEKQITAAFSLLDDESMAGECLWVSPNQPGAHTNLAV